MTSFPFRPPQFSDDVAWLPAWLQSNQSQNTNNINNNTNSSHQSLQNMDSFKGDSCLMKDPKSLPSTENRLNICRLYLSGEDNTPFTASPSCEKVLHFNLYLSADEISTPLQDKTQDDHLLSAKAVKPNVAFQNSRETKASRLGDTHATDPFPSPKIVKGPDNVCSPTQCNSAKAREQKLDRFNSRDRECDITDAIELSVAASEALVIHELVESGSLSEVLSAAAILEISLRVKHALLDGISDSTHSVEEDESSSDILSYFSDSDMEDAYKDVGLSLGGLDNILLKDLSTSRVKETPFSQIHPGEEGEVQSDLLRDQKFCVGSSFATRSRKVDLNTNESKANLSEKSNWNLDDLLKEGNNGDTVNVDQQRPCPVEVNSSPQALHSGKSFEHLTPMDLVRMNDKSSCSFQSRWFGGWTGMDGDAFAGKKLEGHRTIPKLCAAETSYLSESADVAPDQHSFVNNIHHWSKATESSIPLDGSSRTVTGGHFVTPNNGNDFSLSCIDPLCSVVPCSLSAEIGSFPEVVAKDDNLAVCDIAKDLIDDLKITSRYFQMGSDHDDGNVGKREHNQLVDREINPVLMTCQKSSSLRPDSVGIPGHSATSHKRNDNFGLTPPEGNIRFLEQEIRYTNCPVEDELVKTPIVKSTPKTNERAILDEQHTSVLAENIHEKHSASISMLTRTVATNNEKTCETADVGNDTVRSLQENSGKDTTIVPETQDVPVQDSPASPLHLCHRTRRRFKAPRPPLTNSTTGVENKALRSDVTCHKKKENHHDLHVRAPEDDVPARKRVRFSDIETKIHPKKNLTRTLRGHKSRSNRKVRGNLDNFDQETCTTSQEVKERLTKFRPKNKKMVFQGLEFLLTGFSKKKEKEIERILRKHGGMVLSDIPSPHPRGRGYSKSDIQRLPVILCAKKLQSVYFLYGCAANAFHLKVQWAYDSVKAGSVLPPDEYVLLSNHNNRRLYQIGNLTHQNNDDYIFDKVGIMLHGRHSFYSKLAQVIQHGRGRVYKSLQWLVQCLESKKILIAIIVAEDENLATRHLKKCADEQKIPVVPADWIINSLFEGKLLPYGDNYNFTHRPAKRVKDSAPLLDWSQEI